MDTHRRLAARLGMTPAELEALDPASAARLERLLVEAVRRDAAAIDRCMTDALHFMPRPLRAPVRRILGMDRR